jgi:hypothetical protein
MGIGPSHLKSVADDVKREDRSVEVQISGDLVVACHGQGLCDSDLSVIFLVEIA